MVKLPKFYEKCIHCGEKNTIVQELYRDVNPNNPLGFCPFDSKMVPLQDPMKVVSLTVKCAMVHYDICSKCGAERVVKIEAAVIERDKVLAMMGMFQGKSRN